MEEKVKEIRRYKKAILYNEHHNKEYVIKDYMEMEFFNEKIIKLDIEANIDITNIDYLIIKKKGKIKYTFKNELM